MNMTLAGVDLRRLAAGACIVLSLAVASWGLTLLAMENWLMAGALAYVVVFVTLAWHKPNIALSIVFALAPLQPEVSAGAFAKFTAADASLALMVPVFVIQGLVRRQRFHAGPITIPVVLYLAICAWASAGHWRDTTTISMLQMTLYFYVAVMIFASVPLNPQQFRRCFDVLACVGVIIALAGLATSYSFLGMNKNGLGSSLACFVLVCLELWFAADRPARKMWLSLGLMIVITGLVFSLSRGAWIGAMTGGIAILVLRREFRRLFQALILLVPLVAVCWHVMPEESKNYATDFNPDRANIASRYKSLDFAQARFEQNPIYGVGVGLRKEYDATNVVWMTLAETGVLGLLALTLIHATFFRMVWTTQRHLPRIDPAFSSLAIGTALILAKLMHGMVDHYWSRGAITMAWGAAGMATAVYYRVRADAYAHEPAARDVPAILQPIGQKRGALT